MVELIKNKKEIDNIITEKIKGKKLIFTDYYQFGILKRDIPHEKVLEIFPQFEKVFEIEKEKLKHSETGYELFYRLSNNRYFSIATCPKDKKVIIIHTVEYKRDLSKRFKRE